MRIFAEMLRQMSKILP